MLGLPASYGEPLRALERVDAELRSFDAGGGLVLLPEQSLVGYVSPDGDFDLRPFAEPLDGPTARAVRELARTHRLTLVAPLVLADGSRVFNAMIVAGADGELVESYAKRHPWFPEQEWATPGQLPHPLFQLDGLRVSIAVCYDIHFLRFERTTRETLRSADLLLFPSAWVDEHATRIPLLRRTARTFGVVIANANWSAGVVRLPGQGESCIVDAQGELLAVTGGAEHRATAVLTPRQPTSPSA